jgi:hypothetical protein
MHLHHRFPYRQSRLRRRAIHMVVALLLLGIAARPLLAHSRVEIGPYAVVVGWLHEPPIVGERNALVIEISEGDVPVEGAEASLDVELLYAGRTFRTNLTPSLTPGVYTAELFPTVRGQYALRLFGSIGDLEVDETVEPEEVFPASRIQFPESQPDAGELQRAFQADLSALESQLQTARLLAIIGIVAGLLGASLAAYALWKRPPSSLGG